MQKPRQAIKEPGVKLIKQGKKEQTVKRDKHEKKE
jgi:hypothetical protein